MATLADFTSGGDFAELAAAQRAQGLTGDEDIGSIMTKFNAPTAHESPLIEEIPMAYAAPETQDIADATLVNDMNIDVSAFDALNIERQERERQEKESRDRASQERNNINRDRQKLIEDQRAMINSQAKNQAEQRALSAARERQAYDTAKERRILTLGTRLIPTYSDAYYRSRIEEKMNDLIKKELQKETTSSKEKSDSEMLKLVKTLINKNKPKSKKKKPKSKKKKSAKKKQATKRSKKKKKSAKK